MFDFYDYDKNDTIEGQELAQAIMDGKYRSHVTLRS